MTPEQLEKSAADAAISAVLYELQANGVEGEDLQAAAIGALWKAMEDEAVGMSNDALKRLIFGEHPAPQPLTRASSEQVSENADRLCTNRVDHPSTFVLGWRASEAFHGIGEQP